MATAQSRRLRIMLVCGSAPPMPCGVGDYTRQLARALANAGDEVAVLTSTGAEAEASDGVHVMPAMPDWRIGRISRLFRAIRAWRPDVVHLQYPAQGFTSSLLPALVPTIAFVAGARVVRTWHEVTTWHDIRNWRGLILFLVQAVVPGRFISVRPDFAERLHPWLRHLMPRLDYIASAPALPSVRLTADERRQKRAALLGDAERLIVFFGFINPAKGTDDVLAAADPERDRIIFVGGYDPASPLAARLANAAVEGPWAGRVRLTGFVAPDEAAELMAVADAVLLPFKDGSGDWNSSLQAALAQGTLTITTTKGQPGDDAAANIVRVAIDDVAAMRAALDTHAGRRVEPIVAAGWPRIAQAHRDIYRLSRS